MSKGFTPLFGLAVVVALALAAVFGAMAIANPAMAQSVPTLSAKGGDGRVTLSWTAADNNDWQVLRRDDSVNQVQAWADISQSGSGTAAAPYTGTVTGLENGITYTFWVRDADSGGGTPGSRSNAASATPNEPPDQTDDLTVKAGVQQATLTWDDPDDDNITGWEYLQLTSAPADNNAVNTNTAWKGIAGSTGATTSYVVKSLAGGTTYYLAVRALAGDTPSLAATSEDNTAQQWVSAQLKPGPVAELKATPGHESVKLSWKATTDTGVFKYQYRYKKTSGRQFWAVLGRCDSYWDDTDPQS